MSKKPKYCYGYGENEIEKQLKQPLSFDGFL